MLKKSNYRKDIQVLRGLAVLAVVIFHASETYFPLGYLGVDAFFVISGFVVTPLILRLFSEESTVGERFSKLLKFYKSRFYRLAPSLSVALVISSILIFLFGPIDDHQRFARQGIATLFIVGNIGAYKNSGDYFSPNPNPLVHTWSLSVEEQIYIFLPIILMLILHNRTKQNKLITFVLRVIGVLSFISYLFPIILKPLYMLVGIELASLFSFYSPIERIWQFALGGLVFLWLERHQTSMTEILKKLNLFFIIGVIFIFLFPPNINIKVGSIIASLMTVFIIVFKSLDTLPRLITKWLTWVGDRSYSIYLFHMPLLYIARYSPVTQLGMSENRGVQAAIAVITSMLLGALNYSKVENRFRSRGKSNSGDFKYTLALLVSTLALPLLLFMSMEIGNHLHYLGLDRTTQQPLYAAELDSKCARDSLNGPPCVYQTAGAAKTVLLIGDSHAGHISQALVDAARSANWNAIVWAHGGCRIQFQRSISNQVSDICLGMNKTMKKWVRENKPDLIIVSQFVRSYSSQRDLRNALLDLHSIAPNILLIENNPVFPDKKEFMVKLPIVMPTYNPPKSYPQSQMQIADKNASDRMASWARFNGISTMSLNSLFCKKGLCSRYSTNGWLYRDVDHFSVAGAKLTIPQLKGFLESF